ncbi:MAG: alanine racemase [Candidatus Bostrichicola ureolyticus]|nr:MAG: alanine racemase [Candidatus Bostrichicola ureolyticus]
MVIISKGINNCLIIKDTYNLNLKSIKIAVDFIQIYKNYKKTLIIYDFIINTTIIENLKFKINRLIIIGTKIPIININKNFCYYYLNTKDFIKKFHFKNEIILIKGNNFGVEQIVESLEENYNITVYEINLKSLIFNLNYFKKYYLKTTTKIMVMVKSFSYGSSSSSNCEIPIFLQNHVDYLGVASVNEGINLRNCGITIPIMVMNPDCSNFIAIIKYNLEPSIYNFYVLKKFLIELKKHTLHTPYPIHIKIDTGMHRLGFLEYDIIMLGNILLNEKKIFVKSIFSHLAVSDNKKESKFTLQQINKFNRIYILLTNIIKYNSIKHILNTSGIVNFPKAQFDMVRLGLGIYGIISENSFLSKKLRVVCVLKTIISQIKKVSVGSTIGYGLKYKVKKNIIIAIIPIGYADIKLGLYGYIMIDNHKAFIITICMDMLIVDITYINCKEGDEVIIFGKKPNVMELAKMYNTIPYQIFTSISFRVKRIYLY